MELEQNSKEETECKDIEDMIEHAIDNDIEQRFVKTPWDFSWEFRSTFSRRFSSTPSKVDRLHNGVTTRPHIGRL